MMAPPAYSSPERPPRSLTNVLARVFDVGGSGDGIDFARVGGVLGIASGILGFVVGQIAIAIGMLGVVGGVFGVVATGVFGVVTGGVLGVVVGGAVGPAIFLRDWNFRGSFSALVRRAADPDAGPAASGLMVTPSCRMMRVASGLMPRAAGRRWLEEAENFLLEAPIGFRRRVIRNYLLTAPLVIAMSWTSALARRTRLTVGRPTDRQGNASGDPSG
jgi:hypothetical protein